MQYPYEQTFYVTEDDQKFSSYDEAASWQSLLSLVYLYKADGSRIFLQDWADLIYVATAHIYNVLAAQCYFDAFAPMSFVNAEPPFKPGWYRVSLSEKGELRLQEVEKIGNYATEEE